MDTELMGEMVNRNGQVILNLVEEESRIKNWEVEDPVTWRPEIVSW